MLRTDTVLESHATMLEQVQALLKRAEASATSRSTNQKNSHLLQDMAVALVALLTRVTELEQAAAETPRIVVP